MDFRARTKGATAPKGAAAALVATAAAAVIFGCTSSGSEAACPLPPPSVPTSAQVVKVQRVVDGDTVQLADGTRLRILGVNAPETGSGGRRPEPYSREATAFTRAGLEGQTIRLQPGRTPQDEHGRTLGWVWLPDGRFWSGELVGRGLARAYYWDDNPDHGDFLLSCQRQARRLRRGLWRV